jgi:hypothetical protein
VLDRRPIEHLVQPFSDVVQFGFIIPAPHQFKHSAAPVVHTRHQPIGYASALPLVCKTHKT